MLHIRHGSRVNNTVECFVWDGMVYTMLCSCEPWPERNILDGETDDLWYLHCASLRFLNAGNCLEAFQNQSKSTQYKTLHKLTSK